MKSTYAIFLPPSETKARIIYFGKLLACTVLTVAVLMTDLSLAETLITIFVIFGLVYRLNPTYPLSIGLFFLVATPIFLELNRQDWSDRTVVYAFYFLAIGTVSALFEKHPVKYYKNNTPHRTTHPNEEQTPINTQDVLSSNGKNPSQKPSLNPLPQLQKPAPSRQEIGLHPQAKPRTKIKLIQG